MDVHAILCIYYLHGTFSGRGQYIVHVNNNNFVTSYKILGRNEHLTEEKSQESSDC